MTGEVYALASGKGGVGKTTIATNLGVTLRAAGHSVVLVDADLGMANLTTLLDVEMEETVHDVLAGDATVEDALTEEADGFGILPGTRELSGFAAADPDNLGVVLDSLAATYDFVLVDTGGGLSYEDALPLGLADEIILITTPGPAAIGDTEKTAELAELVGGTVRGVIVNRAVDTVDPDQIAADLETSLLGAIPDDRAVTESMLAGKPLQAHAPDSPAAAAFSRLVATLEGETEAAPTATIGKTGTGNSAASAAVVGVTDAETATTSEEGVEPTADDAVDELDDGVVEEAEGDDDGTVDETGDEADESDADDEIEESTDESDGSSGILSWFS